MKTPKISVIMSAYNSEKFISKSIDSILAQTFKNFELIIINDSSIDKTKDIIETYRKKDKRIKIICNRQNLGPAKSRNRALKIAKGEYIAIMDSDDVSLPKRLEVQYHFLENNPDIFLIGGGAIKINESGEVIADKLDMLVYITGEYWSVGKRLERLRCSKKMDAIAP